MIEEKAIPVKIASIPDLVRLALSMSNMASRVYIVHFTKGNKHFYGLLVTFRDYYKYYGLPIFYYVTADEEIKGKYLTLQYDTREKLIASEKPVSGYISVPVINLDREPVFLELSD